MSEEEKVESSAIADGTSSGGKLSKAELKKLAKKAEKAAKKAEHKGGGGGDAVGGVDGEVTTATTGADSTTGSGGKNDDATKPTTQTATTTTTSCAVDQVQPKPEHILQIVNPNPSNSNTIKVMWTSQLYDVPIEVNDDDTKDSNEPYLITKIKNTTTSSSSSTTLNVSGDDGNAMAMTVYFCSTTNNPSPCYYVQHSFMDEWLEWERSILVPAITKTNKELIKVLQSFNDLLTDGIHSSSPYHLIGNTTTIADVCIMTTLAMTIEIQKLVLHTSLPSAVLLYYNTHIKSYHDTIQMINNETVLKELSFLKVVSKIFVSTIRTLYGNDDVTLPEHIVKTCQNMKHGDYQCSAAMPVFAHYKALEVKVEGQPQSPHDVANAIVQSIGTEHSIIMDLNVQGPGFVICRLRPSFLQQHIIAQLSNVTTSTTMSSTASSTIPPQLLKVPNVGMNQTCVVDFSSPNIAKEMHVGHLRSTIIGESICRILEICGYTTVHRINHVGDWGTQFGMLIQYLREEYPDVVNDDNATLPNITDLTTFYKNAKERFDINPEFKKQSQLNVVDLQAGAPDCIKIWKMLCDISRNEFQKVYNRLDVTVEEYGESFYNNKIANAIIEFNNANLITISDDGGAKCVFFQDRKKYPIPLMLQKSDGGYGYDSTDIACIQYRLYTLKANRLIYITDFTQGDHFKMIFQAANDIGWIDNASKQFSNDTYNHNVSVEHIGFGTVQGEDGKRFKTRSGETVRLVDLLDEAVIRMETTLRERMIKQKEQQEQKELEQQASSDETTPTVIVPTATPMSDDEIHQVAEAIGYGAVKYFDLRRNPTSNYKFSYDQMLSTVGDTAVYLIYARVRLDSIIQKASIQCNINIQELIKDCSTILNITEDVERLLLFQLLQFYDIILMTLNDLYPCHICEYLYKLATIATDFVTQCRVIDINNVSIMKSRLLLCYCTSISMNQCFHLLGIRHVQRI